MGRATAALCALSLALGDVCCWWVLRPVACVAFVLPCRVSPRAPGSPLSPHLLEMLGWLVLPRLREEVETPL